MALTKLGTGYSLGDQEIDEQHHELFEMTDRISAAVASRSLNVAEELAALMLYASEHFYSEEALMARIAYPDLLTHRMAHRAFTRQLMRFTDQIHGACPPDWNFFGDFAITWMRTHVLTGNMDIRRYLLEMR
jgi:hemerythrin